MRADSMAEKLLCNNAIGFWNDVRALNRSAALLPSIIEGISGAHYIADLWRQHYSALFNYVKSEPYVLGNIAKSDTVIITPSEVQQPIAYLCENKATGSDGITAEHLKYASQKVAVLLAMCFTGFMTHGQLPDSLLSVTLVPVIKDKTSKVGSLNNYRPIALATVISKVLEKILLGQLNQFISTTDNQFGFRAKLGTDFCIYGLKEAARAYLRKHSSVLIGFIDASKAFDRVNHYKLFDKLKRRGVPNIIAQILVYWYSNQKMHVKWGNNISASFGVSNGVRQGSLLSPALFNLYMDDLSKEMNFCKTGCMIGDTLVNHFMYADDLAVLSPSSAGFQQLLNI